VEAETAEEEAAIATKKPSKPKTGKAALPLKRDRVSTFRFASLSLFILWCQVISGVNFTCFISRFVLPWLCLVVYGRLVTLLPNEGSSMISACSSYLMFSR
jgi:hypothetical protein